jgi:hypothetical protein
MPYLGDYRRKGYTILTLICLVLIYFKLYSKSNDEKTKQILSSGSIDSTYEMHISYLPLLFLSSHTISLDIKTAQPHRFFSLSSHEREYHRSLFVLGLEMNHMHDHAAMLANTTASMDHHHHHMMNHSMETSTMAMGGHGMHMGEMMMMAVSWACHGITSSAVLRDRNECLTG